MAWLAGQNLDRRSDDDRLIQGRNYAYKPVVLNDISKFSKNEILGKALRIKVVYASKYSLHGQFDES